MSSMIEAAKASFIEAMRRRVETDRIMSPLWILAPLLGFVTYIAIAIIIVRLYGPMALMRGTSYAIFMAASLVYLVIQAVLLYLLIKRRSEHLIRDVGIRESLINYIRSLAAETGKAELVTAEVATMSSIHAEANAEERYKSPILWTILCIIPMIGWFIALYVFYFLTKDPIRHDRRQTAFIQQAQLALSKLGRVVAFPTWKQLPDRSYFLYLILTLITGIFAIYWLYVLIKDFNEHFKAQWQFEDQVYSAMMAPPAGA